MSDPKSSADSGKEQPNETEMTEAEIDRNLADTFPASDPPSWTLGTDHANHSPAQPTHAPEPEDDSDAR